MAKKYKFTVVATDVAIFTIKDGELSVLLIKMKQEPFTKQWALPGGLVRIDESVDDAATRYLFTQTGLKNVYLEQLYTFGEVDRDVLGRVVSVAYFALIPSGGVNLKTTSEYDGVDWFPVKKLPTLAYDHKDMIDVAIKRIRNKLKYTNLVYGIAPKEFTLGQLQEIYEILLDKKLDKRNFRKKFLSLGLITPTGNLTSGQAHRPAELYSFKSKKLQEVDVL